MRTFALIGVSAMAISMMASAPASAFSSEQGSAQATNGVAWADPEDKLKELQDKIKGGPDSKTGFYITGPNGQQSDGSGFASQGNGSGAPFGYSPIPGFRGR